MKINNKGMTLVELIVTFALLLILIVGLYNLILDIKLELDNKQIAKDLTEYSATINNKIHYNMLKKEPFAIAYKSNKSAEWKCEARNINSLEGSCAFENGFIKFEFNSLTKVLSLTGDNDNINKDYCSNIFPCAVYAYIDGAEEIKLQTIALKIKDISKDSSNTNINGILYEGIIEPLPDPESTETKAILFSGMDGTEINEEDKPSITFKDNIFIINFPFYIQEDNHNYGFKIAYPFTEINPK